jgi:hypothetical protein
MTFLVSRLCYPACRVLYSRAALNCRFLSRVGKSRLAPSLYCLYASVSWSFVSQFGLTKIPMRAHAPCAMAMHVLRATVFPISYVSMRSFGCGRRLRVGESGSHFVCFYAFGCGRLASRSQRELSETTRQGTIQLSGQHRHRYRLISHTFSRSREKQRFKLESIKGCHPP